MSLSGNDHEERLFTDINVTPLTDVFMVLLVIFMVAAPLMIQSAIRVNLPQVASREDLQAAGAMIVTITKTGQYFVNGERVSTTTELQQRVKEAVGRDPLQAVIVNADRGVLHGQVVEVIDTVKQAGATRLAIGIEAKEAIKGSGG